MIKNVNFSTDGRKKLLMEFELEYNREFEFDGEIVFCVYANNKIIPESLGGHGLGEQLSKNREKFSFQIPDYELKLKTNATNNISLTFEAYQVDERWDGTQDLKIFPVIASRKINLKLYYEFHMFGKNILEIKK